MSVARVDLWGSRVGAVAWDPERELGFFEYDPDFRSSGIELAPLEMPLGERVWSFPALARATFHGLPGMLADSLPDRFGSALVDAWLASRGRTPESFDPVERLGYVGSRGMGALEYAPDLGEAAGEAERLDVAALVALASDALSDREAFVTSLAEGAHGDAGDAVRHILQVGTSAGGARAKALIAWNPDTGEVRSGQVDAPPGFSHWLLKFDGVAGNRDRDLSTPLGFGLVEYVYHRMAVAAGIEMSECRILAENGRHHFVTRRFDRDAEGGKLHLQSLCALAHLDYNLAGAHSYEQAFQVARRLELPIESLEQLFLRMVFNVLARNQDDHTKNVAFLMDKEGRWSLAPAFDLTFAYNPSGAWTSRHQMSLNGKRDDLTLADLTACEKTASLRRGFALEAYERVRAQVQRWPELAAEARVPEPLRARVGEAHRAELPGE